MKSVSEMWQKRKSERSEVQKELDLLLLEGITKKTRDAMQATSSKNWLLDDSQQGNGKGSPTVARN